MPVDHSIDLEKGKPLNAKRDVTPKSDAWFDRGSHILERFGLPTLLLLAVLCAFGYGSWWIGNKILIPVAERHIQFVDTIEKERAGDKDLLREISSRLGELANQQRLTNQILRKNGQGRDIAHE